MCVSVVMYVKLLVKAHFQCHYHLVRRSPSSTELQLARRGSHDRRRQPKVSVGWFSVALAACLLSCIVLNLKSEEAQNYLNSVQQREKSFATFFIFSALFSLTYYQYCKKLIMREANYTFVASQPPSKYDIISIMKMNANITYS